MGKFEDDTKIGRIEWWIDWWIESTVIKGYSRIQIN